MHYHFSLNSDDSTDYIFTGEIPLLFRPAGQGNNSHWNLWRTSWTDSGLLCVHPGNSFLTAELFQDSYQRRGLMATLPMLTCGLVACWWNRGSENVLMHMALPHLLHILLSPLIIDRTLITARSNRKTSYHKVGSNLFAFFTLYVWEKWIRAI